ncbi:hypothetical protein [Pseudoxanthomonas mexicana]
MKRSLFQPIKIPPITSTESHSLAKPINQVRQSNFRIADRHPISLLVMPDQENEEQLRVRQILRFELLKLMYGRSK